MKKVSFFMLFVVLSLCLCACATTREIDPLDGFKVTTVAGVEVKDGSVTLTQSQYNAFVASPEDNCQYTIASGVTAKISVTENKLVFDLTTTGGNKGKYEITLTVVPDVDETDPLDGFKVTTVAGVEVKDNSVTLTQSQYNALVASPKDNCQYTIADGVTAKISVSETKLIFDLTTTGGNKGKYEITLTVVPDVDETDPLEGFKVTTVAGVEVKDNSVTLSQSQ